MKFQTKILLVTLSILILTLVINSVLSLASFEKVYVKSQISTYELICKDLKRKIERSLRFGKPLEKFKNMDSLLQDMLEQNPGIDTIAVSDLKGLVLYQTDGKDAVRNISDIIPPLDETVSVKTILKDNNYHSFIGIIDRTKKQVGIIKLTFSRDIIIEKLKSMANKNLNMLWVLILMTSISLIFLLAIVIMRPINAQVLEMRKILNSGEAAGRRHKGKDEIPGKPDGHGSNEDQANNENDPLMADYLQLSTVRNEIDKLEMTIEAFAGSVAGSMDKLDHLYDSQDQFASSCDAFHAAKDEFTKSVLPDMDGGNEDERHRMEMMMRSMDHLDVQLKTLIRSTEPGIELEQAPDPVDHTPPERDGI